MSTANAAMHIRPSHAAAKSTARAARRAASFAALSAAISRRCARPISWAAPPCVTLAAGYFADFSASMSSLAVATVACRTSTFSVKTRCTSSSASAQQSLTTTSW